MLTHDPYPAFEFLKLGQLGDLFGVSATAVGTKLKQGGLRLPNGDPSPKAKDARMAKLVSVEGIHPFWVWEKVRTVKVLEAVGCRQLATFSAPSPSPPTPVSEKPLGPFEGRRSWNEASDGFEIADANGVVAVWARGEQLASQLAHVMTLADRCGKLSRKTKSGFWEEKRCTIFVSTVVSELRQLTPKANRGGSIPANSYAPTINRSKVLASVVHKYR